MFEIELITTYREENCPSEVTENKPYHCSMNIPKYART